MATVSPTPPWKQNIPLHLAKAHHNLRLYHKLKDEGEFLDWALTALFYTALHLIQACLLDSASDAFDYPKSHAERETFIRRKLGDIWPHYNTFQNQSTRARYHPAHPQPTPLELQHYEDGPFASILAALERRGITLSL